jgi:hypothetical protein
MKVKITIKKRNEKGIESKITITGNVAGSPSTAGDLLYEMEREANTSGKIRVWVEEDK